ncbi:hypothetical protein [Clostridium perfringens]|uniref:hypothetical protein n=1 Tax=Clostridium perfringens TaxID=1502 RepID=UPI0024BC21F8|nr:hypothetical protein [Clostridium perfringens]
MNNDLMDIYKTYPKKVDDYISMKNEYEEIKEYYKLQKKYYNLDIKVEKIRINEKIRESQELNLNNLVVNALIVSIITVSIKSFGGTSTSIEVLKGKIFYFVIILIFSLSALFVSKLVTKPYNDRIKRKNVFYNICLSVLDSISKDNDN